MGTALLTWELGAGLGHLVNLLPIAEGLKQRGHRVVAALKDLSRADRFFGSHGVEFVQAPVRQNPPPALIEPPRTYAHVLHNIGFADAAELRTFAKGWRYLINMVDPDLIVFDHSPTALLAAQSCRARKVLIGTGFFQPLDEYPLTDLQPWLPPDADRWHADEDRLLNQVNGLLAEWGSEPFGRLSQLYHRVDDSILATFPELDHFANRQGGQYYGAWPYIGGKPPVWPSGGRRRIYAYLNPFPALIALLQMLADSGESVLVSVNKIDDATVGRFAGDRMRFEREPLDMSQVATECHAAVLNGNHGTTVGMLMAGRPLLQVPFTLEQVLFSLAVKRLGAATVATPQQSNAFATRFQRLMDGSSYREAAQRFATTHADYDPRREIGRIIDRCNELIRGHKPVGQD